MQLADIPAGSQDEILWFPVGRCSTVEYLHHSHEHGPILPFVLQRRTVRNGMRLVLMEDPVAKSIAITK